MELRYFSLPGNRGIVKYSIHSGDPGYFVIDPVSGSIKIANPLDHESHSQVLLNIQAFSSENPASFGHTQVNYLHSLSYKWLINVTHLIPSFSLGSHRNRRCE